MRHAFLVVLFCLIAVPIARAQDAAPEPAANAVTDRVQLVEDDQNGKLRIVIDGKEVGWFDATGFYVNGNIAYAGTITDGLPTKEAPDAP